MSRPEGTAASSDAASFDSELANPVAGFHFGIALPQAAFALPLTIIILRPFFRSIPRELEDAAQIDGCSPFGFFWRVLLPLSRPALATVAVLAIVTSWNSFLLPLVILSDQENWTLPLGVTNFSTQYSSDTAAILAYTTLSLIPALAWSWTTISASGSKGAPSSSRATTSAASASERMVPTL